MERRQAEVAELHLRALEALARAALAEGDWAGAITAAAEAIGRQPFRESAHLVLMDAHARAGNRGEALRAYSRCRQALVDELGVDPSRPTEAAYLRLLGDDPAPAPLASAATVPLPAALAPVPGSFLVGRAAEVIVFRFTSEDAATSAFKNGEGDLVVGHAGPDVVSQLRSLPGVNTRVVPGRGQEHVGFNLRNELLAMPEVRKAFGLAMDRRSIVERAVGNAADVSVVNSFLFADSHPDYRDTSGGRYERPDVPGAKRLFDGAGFAFGSDGVYAREGKRLSFRPGRSPSRLMTPNWFSSRPR